MKGLLKAIIVGWFVLSANSALAYFIDWQSSSINEGNISGVNVISPSYNSAQDYLSASVLDPDGSYVSASVDATTGSGGATLFSYSQVTNGGTANANNNFFGTFNINPEGALGTSVVADIVLTLSGDFNGFAFELNGASYALNYEPGGTATTVISSVFEIGTTYDMYAYLYSVSGLNSPVEERNSILDISFIFPSTASAVPIPSTLFLFATGLLFLSRRRLGSPVPTR